MDLAVYIARPDLARVRMAAEADDAIHVALDTAGLDVMLRTRAIDVAVIDPQAPGLGNVAALRQVVARYPGIPIILYVGVNADAMRRTLTLQSLGVRHVVLRGVEDEPRAFRATIERARACLLIEHVIHRLESAFARLAPCLAVTLQLVLRTPRCARTAGEIAVLAGLPPRTCSRMLERGHVATAHSFRCAARVLHAYHSLRGGGKRVADVASQLGYCVPDTLALHTRMVTKKAPIELMHTVGPEELVAVTVDFLSVRRGR